jgi:hypothetical protein
MTMVYLHEIWLNGSREPHRLRLENDDLFQAYQRWVQDDVGFKARGFVLSYTEKEELKTVAFNFSGVSCITVEKIDEANERRSMGFGDVR